jgi:hypothetical protein
LIVTNVMVGDPYRSGGRSQPAAAILRYFPLRQPIRGQRGTGGATAAPLR